MIQEKERIRWTKWANIERKRHNERHDHTELTDKQMEQKRTQVRTLSVSDGHQGHIVHKKLSATQMQNNKKCTKL